MTCWTPIYFTRKKAIQCVCDRGENALYRILDLQKIEAGLLQLDQQPLALTPLIRQSLETNAGYGEKYNVTFRHKPRPCRQPGFMPIQIACCR